LPSAPLLKHAKAPDENSGTGGPAALFPPNLFPGHRVRVLANGKYGCCGDIDLLLLGDCWRLHVLELKAKRVANNRGVTPDDIWGQMDRYVRFLRDLPSIPDITCAERGTPLPWPSRGRRRGPWRMAPDLPASPLARPTGRGVPASRAVGTARGLWRWTRSPRFSTPSSTATRTPPSNCCRWSMTNCASWRPRGWRRRRPARPCKRLSWSTRRTCAWWAGSSPRTGTAARTVIGPYKLLQQIGEGGMGAVFMAEQAQPVRRKVALKVIKPGMDSRQVIARFEAERQALAMMDHVNIARVFDGGATENGRPYFVMELVHGVPITKYCDDNHLTPRQRLELFVPVCQAIQHAHQKGIIHRDIKPSNVLVTLDDGKPAPKVIDFGVAKATEQKLTERTLFTQYGTMVGTLEYMSPEQAEMSALGVDTRNDIFSLSVLLYELLTGTPPLTHKRLKEAAYAEILRLIKEEEPQKPSPRLSDSGEALASISAQRHMAPAKLAKLVRGELDWIVMKTLEKDRNRRYETANAFAADVQRYLNDETVQACPRGERFGLEEAHRDRPSGGSRPLAESLPRGLAAARSARAGAARGCGSHPPSAAGNPLPAWVLGAKSGRWTRPWASCGARSTSTPPTSGSTTSWAPSAGVHSSCPGLMMRSASTRSPWPSARTVRSCTSWWA
jgi:serine/threonine protein kinase